MAVTNPEDAIDCTGDRENIKNIDHGVPTDPGAVQPRVVRPEAHQRCDGGVGREAYQAIRPSCTVAKMLRNNEMVQAACWPLKTMAVHRGVSAKG